MEVVTGGEELVELLLFVGRRSALGFLLLVFEGLESSAWILNADAALVD